MDSKFISYYREVYIIYYFVPVLAYDSLEHSLAALVQVIHLQYVDYAYMI